MESSRSVLRAATFVVSLLTAGAVAAVRNVRNPISLARQVMERSPHILLTGSGADDYARELGVRRAPQDYFTTDRRFRQWQQARRDARRRGSGGGAPPGPGAEPFGLDTVGAVALDRYGNLAAATSSGGLTNKRYGRVGDVPILGAGTYANNRTAALSCTGRGEEILRHVVAHEISARIEHGGATLEEAAEAVVREVLAPGDGGVIGVDARGSLALLFNSSGMFRGAADSSGRFEVGIWEEMRRGEPPEPSAGAGGTR